MVLETELFYTIYDSFIPLLEKISEKFDINLDELEDFEKPEIKNLYFENSYNEVNPREYHCFIDGDITLSYDFGKDCVCLEASYEYSQTYDNRCEPDELSYVKLTVNTEEYIYNNFEDVYGCLSEKELCLQPLNKLLEKYDIIDIMKIEKCEVEKFFKN